MKSSSKLIIAMLLLVSAALLKSKPSTVTLDNADGDLFKTVAHIDLSSRSDLKLVYTDTENDIAYYCWINNKNNIEVGTTVYLYDNTECYVTYTDAYGFGFKGDVKVLEGLSGTAVRNAEGNQLGYVSRLLNTGEIYCIWS